MKTYLSLLIILFVTQPQWVIGQKLLAEEDLSFDWVFYDYEEKSMLPFLEHGQDTPEAIHLSINLTKYGKESKLLIGVPKNSSLFLDNKFTKHYVDSTRLLLSIDSLNILFDKKILQLTVFNKSGFKNPINAKIGFIHRTFDSSIDLNPVEKRYFDIRSEYFKIIILMIFVFFVILHSLFPTELMEFYSLRILVTFRITNTLLLNYRSISKIQLLVIFYQATVLSGILIIFLNYYETPLSQAYFLQLNPIIGWLMIFGIVMILMFVKYLLISIFSLLFGIGEKINFYFVEILRMAMIFYSLLFAVLSYAVINHFNSLKDLLEGLIFIIVFFYLFRFIILFIKFRRSVSMKSLYLFSYLCTTEIVPIIIGLNFFLK